MGGEEEEDAGQVYGGPWHCPSLDLIPRPSHFVKPCMLGLHNIFRKMFFQMQDNSPLCHNSADALFPSLILGELPVFLLIPLAAAVVGY